MNPQQIIQKAIDDISTYKKAYGKKLGVDPKWTNRTLSHLDNAWACAGHIVAKGSLIEQAPEVTSGFVQACTCPEGAVDTRCPVHSKGGR